jgi:hypothetical protein
MSQTKSQLIEGSAASELTAAKILLGAGSAGAPSLTATGDTNTGIFFPTADTIAFAEGGVETVRIDSSGRLGIGTTPGVTLDVNGQIRANNDFLYADATATRGRIYGDSTGLVVRADTGLALRFHADAGEKARIDTSGRLLVGTSTSIDPGAASSSIHMVDGGGGKIYMMRDDAGSTVADNDLGMIRFYSNDGGIQESARIEAEADLDHGTDDKPGRLVFSTTADGASSPTERLRITSAGLVGIGTTPNSDSRLHVKSGANDSNPVLRLEAGTNNFLNFRQTGSVYDIHVTAGDPLSFTIGASERARIDSSGRLLVGTSSSSEVNTAVFQGNSAAGSAANVTISSSINNPTSTQAIGVLSFSDNSHVKAAQIVCLRDGGTWTSGTSQPSALTFYTTNDGASSPTDRMKINRSGELAMMCNANNYNLFISNASTAGTTYRLIDGKYGSQTAYGGTTSFIVYTNGNVQNTNNSYGALSDIKLKENVVDANSQWDDLKALQVRNYNFKEGQTHTQIGLVAQEVELVSPGLVSESPDRDEEGNDLGTVTKSVNYSVLYMKAVKALQEAIAKIETLEGMVAVNNITIDEQQHQLSTLAARLTALESA